MAWCFRCLFLLLGALPVVASAEAYYYSGEVKGRFASAQAACQADAEDYSNRWPSPLISATISHRHEYPGTYNCRIRMEAAHRWTVIVRRGGDACPEGLVLDLELGQCKEPPKDCKAETGDILTRGSIAGIVVSNGRTYSLSQSPASACVDSCTFALKDTGRSRYTSCYLVKGSQVDSFCNYILTGTGEPCAGWNWAQPETGDPLNPADTPDAPPSDPNDPGCPKGWSWSGTTCHDEWREYSYTTKNPWAFDTYNDDAIRPYISGSFARCN